MVTGRDGGAGGDAVATGELNLKENPGVELSVVDY